MKFLLIFLQTLDLIQVSDIHGYVDGQLRQPEYADFANLVSYVDYQKLQQPTLFSIVGDLCDGTLFSDHSNPRCKHMVELVKQSNMDVFTPGNHDLYWSSTVENLQNSILDRMVSTNVVYKSGQPLKCVKFKEIIIKNIRILNIGLTVSGEYESVTTINVSELFKEIRSQLIENMLKNDFLLVHFHQTFSDDEVKQFYRQIISIQAQIGHKYPFYIQNAHGHQKYSNYCYKDKSCFMVEAGKYLQQMQHTRVTFMNVNYQYDGKSYKGLQFQKIETVFTGNFYLKDYNGQKGIFDTQFKNDSQLGLSIRDYVKNIQKLMKNDKPIAKMKFELRKYNSQNDFTKNDSLLKYFVEFVVPNAVKMKVACQTFAQMGIGSVRKNLPIGLITIEDLHQVYPFDNKFTFITNLTLRQSTCLVVKLQSPRYLIGEIKGKCQNFVFSDHDRSYVEACLQSCLIGQKIHTSQLTFEKAFLDAIWVAFGLKQDSKTIKTTNQIIGIVNSTMLFVLIIFTISKLIKMKNGYERITVETEYT